jgi:hypothetical protein
MPALCSISSSPSIVVFAAPLPLNTIANARELFRTHGRYEDTKDRPYKRLLLPGECLLRRGSLFVCFPVPMPFANGSAVASIGRSKETGAPED